MTDLTSKGLLDDAETLLRDFSEQHFKDAPRCSCDLMVRLQRWLERKRLAPETPARPKPTGDVLTDTFADLIHEFGIEKAHCMSNYMVALVGRGFDNYRDAQTTRGGLTEADVVVGGEFWWERDKPAARCKVRVDEIRHDPNGDVRVFTTTLEGTQTNPRGQRTWNDMSRFLEACQPVKTTEKQ